MEHEERKIAKGYAFIALYTIILLVVGILLGFAVGRKSVISERERGAYIVNTPVSKLSAWPEDLIICGLSKVPLDNSMGE